MVCECKDDFFNLWLFCIGKFVWKCFVKVKKYCYYEKEGYRKFLFLFVLLCYCLVVFYFIKKVVLLGILSYVYVMSGELLLFFF